MLDGTVSQNQDQRIHRLCTVVGRAPSDRFLFALVRTDQVSHLGRGVDDIQVCDWRIHPVAIYQWQCEHAEWMRSSPDYAWNN